MFKKLKLKFILLQVVTMTIVITASFVTLYSANKRQLVNMSREDIKTIDIEIKNNINTSAYDINILFKKPFLYIIKYNDGLELHKTNMTTYDKDYTYNLNTYITSLEKKEGIIQFENLFLYYMKLKYPNYTANVAIDISYPYYMLQSLATNLIFFGFSLFFIILIASIIFSNIAVKPIEKNYNKQKQFVTDASHELRTPLTVINSNTDLLLLNENNTIKDQKECVLFIKDEINRITKLTNDLLFLSNATEIKTSLSTYYDINFSDLLINKLLAFEALMFEKSIELNSDISDDIYIKGNINDLTQLIVILLDNAIKYTCNNIINITLQQNYNKCVFKISNKCNNLKTDDVPKLLERFYKADKSRNEYNNKSSYGLGLSIAKAITENYNGTITPSLKNDVITFTVQFKIKS